MQEMGADYSKLCFFLFGLSSLALGFPGSSCKESTCSVGNPDLIPGSGRSPGEGIGYPLQYSWASLVAQLVKNLPAVHVRPEFDPWVEKIPWMKGRGYPLQYSDLENFTTSLFLREHMLDET